MVLKLTFQKAVPGLGKLGAAYPRLGESLPKLDKLLVKARRTELQTFVSEDPGDAADVPDEDGMYPPAEEWFEPVFGQQLVREAILHLESNLRVLPQVRADVVSELKKVYGELILAEVAGTTFHFCLLD